jgi:hypothetical protein
MQHNRDVPEEAQISRGAEAEDLKSQIGLAFPSLESGEVPFRVDGERPSHALIKEV